jgi:hypothetical protein
MATLPCDANFAVFDSNKINISKIEKMEELCILLEIENYKGMIQDLILEYSIYSTDVDIDICKEFEDTILKAILGLFLEKDLMISLVSDALLVYIEKYRETEERCNNMGPDIDHIEKENYCTTNGYNAYYIAIFDSMKSFLDGYFERFDTVLDIEHLFPLLIEILVELIPYLENDEIVVPLPDNVPLEHIPPSRDQEKIMLPIPCNSQSLYNYLVLAVTRILNL